MWRAAHILRYNAAVSALPAKTSQAALSAALGAAGATLLISNTRFLDAETVSSIDDASSTPLNRKSIYEDYSLPPSDPVSTPVPARPEFVTPTDRLTGYISQARLTLHAQAQRLEAATDDLLARAFATERSVASTISSLAPSRESGEKVMPGALYVLVAAMGGSVVTRNRNIVLRAFTPLIFGVATAHAVIPVTTRNVEQLVWRWEQKWPVLADAHEQTQSRVEKFVVTGWEHSKMTKQMLEQQIATARESLEGWVSKGR